MENREKYTFGLFLYLTFISLLIVFQSVAKAASDSERKGIYEWKTIASYPEPGGAQGVFIGVHNDALIIAGGVNNRDSFGGDAWRNDVYVLEKQSDDFYSWHQDKPLAFPRAYGASVATDNGILCIGGRDANRSYSEVILLQWNNGKITKKEYPNLPQPLAHPAAAMAGGTVYVAGSRKLSANKEALKNFWEMDLSVEKPTWRALKPWPGPARFSAIAGSIDEHFYLFGGAASNQDSDSSYKTYFLKDAYRFSHTSGWEQSAELPSALAGAPSSAIPLGQTHLLVFGGTQQQKEMTVRVSGTDSLQVGQEIFAYHTITDTWTKMGTLTGDYEIHSVSGWGQDVVISAIERTPDTIKTEILLGEQVYSKPRFGLVNYVVLACYFFLLVLIGYYFSRREATTEDYFLAGKRIPWWAAGLSIFGTQLSAITFMAIPAKAYATDWVFFLANMGIVLITPVIVYLYLPFYRRLNVTTAYEYLEKRFSLSLRLLGSAQYGLFQLGRMAIVIFLPAIALSTATGLNIYLTIILIGILSTAYTVLGGIEAVIWSDVMQAIVLLGGALVSVIVISLNLDGGFHAIIETGLANNKFHMFNLTLDWTTTAVWVVFVGNTLNQLVPYTSDQTVVQRYLTTSDEKQAAKSIWTNGILVIPASILFFGVGTALYAFYKSNPVALDPTLQTDAIFPLFIIQHLPNGIAGLVIAGVFAAAMSSLDSSMNSTATTFVTDFYYRLHRESTERYRLNLARWITVLLGVFATGVGCAMASIEILSLWDIFLELVSLFGGSLAGLFALGIFTRVHSMGAISGIVASMIFMMLIKFQTDIHFFLYGGLGIAVCMLVGYTASLFLPQDTKSLEGLTIYSLKRKS